MVLDITHYGNPILRKKTKTVTVFDEELKNLCQNMIETMKSANGVGIAAPQVGVDYQIFIADPTPEEEEENKQPPLIVINPVLTPLTNEKTEIAKEGCLSIPDLYANVKRYKKVLLKAVDENNQPFEIVAEDWIARIIQHEFDHLHGILFTDKVLATERKQVDEFLQDFRKKHA